MKQSLSNPEGLCHSDLSAEPEQLLWLLDNMYKSSKMVSQAHLLLGKWIAWSLGTHYGSNLARTSVTTENKA